MDIILFYKTKLAYASAHCAFTVISYVYKFLMNTRMDRKCTTCYEHSVVGREKLLTGSPVSRTHSLLITHRYKDKSSSLTS